MNRQEFMNRLAAELSKLPREEVQAAMEYYNEYLDEAGVENEAQAIKDLGNPARIATQIKADYAVRQLDQTGKAQSARSGLRAIWLVILGVFAAPIALPLAIGLGALLFAIFISLVALVFSLLIGFGALCISGIALIILGIVGLASSVSGGLLLIGVGLMSSGITALLCVGVVIGSRAIIRAITRLLQKNRENRRKRLPMGEVKSYDK